MAILFLTIGGNFIPAIRNHPLYIRMQQYKMAIILGGFIGLNFVTSMLSSTGAFEIFYNGELVFSKLMTGRMP